MDGGAGASVGGGLTGSELDYMGRRANYSHFSAADVSSSPVMQAFLATAVMPPSTANFPVQPPSAAVAANATAARGLEGSAAAAAGYTTSSPLDESGEPFQPPSATPPPLISAPMSADDLDGKYLEQSITTLEELEVDADVFSIPSAVRSDFLLLFGRIVETILIIIAVQHTNVIMKSLDISVVLPLFLLLVYIGSQLRYFIDHWRRRITLVRRRIARVEREEQAYEQQLQSKQPSHQQQMSRYTAAIGESIEDGNRRQLATDTLHNAHRAKHAQQNPYSTAAVTLTNVRLYSTELLFSVGNTALYLFVVYVTFVLVKAVLDRIDANFSDGTPLLAKVIVFVLIVLPVYVESAVNSFRQDVVSRSVRY